MTSAATCQDCKATVTPSGYCVMCGRYNDATAAACTCPDFTGPVDTRHVCPVHGPLYSDDQPAATKRLPLGWKLRYKWPSQLRCLLGIHTLRAHAAPLTPDQVEAVPMHPRSRPGPGDHRVCTWCGARWKGAYDGIEPHWRRS